MDSVEILFLLSLQRNEELLLQAKRERLIHSVIKKQPGGHSLSSKLRTWSRAQLTGQYKWDKNHRENLRLSNPCCKISEN